MQAEGNKSSEQQASLSPLNLIQAPHQWVALIHSSIASLIPASCTLNPVTSEKPPPMTAKDCGEHPDKSNNTVQELLQLKSQISYSLSVALLTVGLLYFP